MMKILFFAACLFALARAGWAADVKTAIEHADRAFVAAFDKGDAAAVAALYAEDATILPPDSDIVHGRAGIQAFWQKAMDGGLKLNPFQIVSLESLGSSAAREIGRTSTQGKDPVGLKYVVVWKRTNGAWRLSTDIWNAAK